MLDAAQALPNTLPPLILTVITRDCIYDSYFLFFSCVMLHARLSSPATDQSCAPCGGSAVLTTGPPGKSHGSHSPYEAREAEILNL